jgi:hypothetical protein
MVNLGTYVEITEDTYNFLKELLDDLNFMIDYDTCNDTIEDFANAITDFLDDAEVIN